MPITDISEHLKISLCSTVTHIRLLMLCRCHLRIRSFLFKVVVISGIIDLIWWRRTGVELLKRFMRSLIWADNVAFSVIAGGAAIAFASSSIILCAKNDRLLYLAYIAGWWPWTWVGNRWCQGSYHQSHFYLSVSDSVQFETKPKVLMIFIY